MKGSHREIIRATSIIGSGSVISIALSVLRMKIAALLLGPAGVGLIGLFQNLVTTGATLSSLGIGTAGTRQIAAAGEDQAKRDRARRALFWGSAGSALLGGALIWCMRGEIARRVLNDPGLTEEVGWLSLGVVLTVASLSQIAFLNGMRRIGDVARTTIAGSILGSAIGVPALYMLGLAGIVPFVIALTLANALAGWFFAARAPRTATLAHTAPELFVEWKGLLAIGVAFTIAGLANPIGQLVVRALLQHSQGPAALGFFQASWAISTTYLGFVLQAMGTDFFPRLSATIHDEEAANRLINDQSEVALLLAGPILLAMIGGAPWVIQLLYSSAFAPAIEPLRWQLLGDVLKLASWPIAFVMLASGQGRQFVLSEVLAVVSFVVFVAAGLPHIGYNITGIGYFGMYLVYLPLVYVLARRRIGFRWERRVIAAFAVLITSSAISFAVSEASEVAGLVVALLLALILAAAAARRLRHSVLGGENA